MKKLIALLLVVVVCSGLAACAQDNGVDKLDLSAQVVGKWSGNSFYGSFELVLKEDMTGELTQDEETEAITWFVDEATRLVVITMKEDNVDYNQAFTYLESKDALYHHEVYCTRAVQ